MVLYEEKDVTQNKEDAILVSFMNSISKEKVA